MTYDQALEKLQAEKSLLERAADDLHTAQLLHHIGEHDKAVSLYASIRRVMREQFKVVAA